MSYHGSPEHIQDLNDQIEDHKDALDNLDPEHPDHGIHKQQLHELIRQKMKLVAQLIKNLSGRSGISESYDLFESKEEGHSIVKNLKVEGKHEEAGKMAFKYGLGRHYGPHFGMQSTKYEAEKAFYRGYDRAALESKNKLSESYDLFESKEEIKRLRKENAKLISQHERETDPEKKNKIHKKIQDNIKKRKELESGKKARPKKTATLAESIMRIHRDVLLEQKMLINEEIGWEDKSPEKRISFHRKAWQMAEYLLGKAIKNKDPKERIKDWEETRNHHWNKERELIRDHS
jgi:hypothetical protein